MHFLKVALMALTFFGAASLVKSIAAAAPVNGLAALSRKPLSDAQSIAWVCSPFRCAWRSNYWGFYQGPFVWNPRLLYPRYYRGPRNYWVFSW
jgi:hypothetical protein